jgi:hypothetical protein
MALIRPAEERIEERRLADVGAAEEGYFGVRGLRERPEVVC